MAEMSLEVQKLRISEVQDSLENMLRVTEYQKKEFEDHLDSALQAGLPVEFYNNYKTHCLTPLYSDLDSLMGNIQHDDMNYLNDVQTYLQEAINKGGGGAFGTGAVTTGITGGGGATTITNNKFANCAINNDEWKKRNKTQKMQQLEKCADDIAKDLGIAKAPIKTQSVEERAVELMKADKELSIEKAREKAKNTNGYYSLVRKEITINEERLSNEPELVVQTLAHEYRHHWQYTGKEVPEKMKDNLKKGNYIAYDERKNNFCEYARQPVEEDARKYGEKVSGSSYPSDVYDSCNANIT
jgi:hypothetical protein